jgi:hypothetical protein
MAGLVPAVHATPLHRPPAAAFAGSRQLATGAASGGTVHAPQTPEPRTSLVPVSPSRSPSSRRTLLRKAVARTIDARQKRSGEGAMGDEAVGLLGVWILRSAYLERADTGEKIAQYGENPRGVLILHEGGRMAAIITPSLQPDDAAPPRRKLVAYSGRYRIEGANRFVTDVDIAWLPTWVGTPRGRNFMLEDGELHIVADPAPVEFLDGAIAVGRLVWAREERAVG